MNDQITLNLVENHKVVRRYVMSLEALQLAPHYVTIIEEALRAWTGRVPSRHVYASFRNLDHIVA